jgi:hypothetical protein
MKTAPDRQWSEAALLAQGRRLIPDISANEVKDALNWNLMKGFIDNAVHNELRCEVWFLTEKGKALAEED